MLKTLKRISYGNLLGGLALAAIGIGLLVIFIIYSYNDFSIWVFGKEITGVVDKTYYVQTGEEAGVQTYKYFIDYSFTSEKGETYHGTTEVSITEYGFFREGGDVLVVYSPFDPSINRIDDTRFRPILFCSYIPVFLIIWFSLMQGWRLISEEVRKPPPIPRLDDPPVTQE